MHALLQTTQSAILVYNALPMGSLLWPGLLAENSDFTQLKMEPTTLTVKTQVLLVITHKAPQLILVLATPLVVR